MVMPLAFRNEIREVETEFYVSAVSSRKTVEELDDKNLDKVVEPKVSRFGFDGQEKINMKDASQYLPQRIRVVLNLLRPTTPLLPNVKTAIAYRVDPVYGHNADMKDADLTYTWVDNQQINGTPCWVIRQTYTQLRNLRNTTCDGTFWVSMQDKQVMRWVEDNVNFSFSPSFNDISGHIEMNRRISE